MNHTNNSANYVCKVESHIWSPYALQTQLQRFPSYLLCTLLLFSFHFLTSSMRPTGFSLFPLWLPCHLYLVVITTTFGGQTEQPSATVQSQRGNRQKARLWLAEHMYTQTIRCFDMWLLLLMVLFYLFIQDNAVLKEIYIW